MGQHIRQGNDLIVKWSILTKEGEPYDLSGKSIHLEWRTLFKKKDITTYSVIGNEVEWTYYGREQELGDYTLSLVVNKGRIGMVSLDVCSAFRIVPCSGDVSDCCCEDMDIHTSDSEVTAQVSLETIELESRLSLSGGGSAPGGGKQYTLQSNPQVIEHGFDYRPSVTISDVNGEEVIADVRYNDELGTIEISWQNGAYNAQLLGGKIYVI